MDNTKKSTFWY